MSVLINSIGGFSFLDLAGGVELPKQMVEIEQRPGTDGTQARTLGFKGRPFTIRSRCDALSVTDAQDTFADYCDLIGTMQPLVQYGLDYTSLDTEFMVLDVKPTSIRAQVFMVGGLHPPSQGWIEAEWTLVPVDVS